MYSSQLPNSALCQEILESDLLFKQICGSCAAYEQDLVAYNQHMTSLNQLMTN